jgi:hypothetical protein
MGGRESRAPRKTTMETPETCQVERRKAVCIRDTARQLHRSIKKRHRVHRVFRRPRLTDRPSVAAECGEAQLYYLLRGNKTRRRLAQAQLYNVELNIALTAILQNFTIVYTSPLGTVPRCTAPRV